MKRSALLVFASGLAFTRAASADIGDWEGNYDPGPAERRSGFAAGASFSAMFGAVTAYPNEVEKIGVERFEAATGAAGGTAAGFWVGAALRDWLVLGVQMNVGSVAGADGALSNGGSFGLRVEGFPLFYRGGVFRDLGLVGEFGVGSRDVFLRSDEDAGEGGVVSSVTFGVIYEPIRIGEHLSTGPMLQVNHQFSDSLTGTFVTAGMQLSFYGGPG